MPTPPLPAPPLPSPGVQGGGIKLRGPVSGIWQYPTLVIFCEGDGIATAKALIETTPEMGGLNLNMRSDVRMYYRVSACISLFLRETKVLRETKEGKRDGKGGMKGVLDRACPLAAVESGSGDGGRRGCCE